MAFKNVCMGKLLQPKSDFKDISTRFKVQNYLCPNLKKWTEKICNVYLNNWGHLPTTGYYIIDKILRERKAWSK